MAKRATKTKAATKSPDIELRPCEGIDKAGKHVVFAQDQIFHKGIRLGYVGHEPGTSLCLIVPVDKSTLEKIHKAIEAKFGKQPSATLTAPVIPDSPQASEDEYE